MDSKIFLFDFGDFWPGRKLNSATIFRRYVGGSLEGSGLELAYRWLSLRPLGVAHSHIFSDCRQDRSGTLTIRVPEGHVRDGHMPAQRNFPCNSVRCTTVSWSAAST